MYVKLNSEFAKIMKLAKRNMDALCQYTYLCLYVYIHIYYGYSFKRSKYIVFFITNV